MSIYIPYDNKKDDMPIQVTENAIRDSGFQSEAIIPLHFTVFKERENNG